ncbi:MAG TPA: prepilin-type N-terminal cleavage/methylation domain-containing protein, partial [Polyangiaceae bacterium]|nr:prepilin-type N-terminal cleavage/methylation domain-containing protein [Polyangiaceae bacterium]
MSERPKIVAHSPSQLRHRRAERAFTLIELVVVVVIIGLLAALATPAITDQMRDRRANQASQELANFYRGARMRALGRGSSVLVRYQK